MFPIKEYPGHAKFRGLIKSFVRSNTNENVMMETNFGGGFYEVEFEDGDVEKMSLEEVKACTHRIGTSLIGRSVEKDFGPQRGFVKRYRKKKDEFVVEYFESNWKEVVQKKSDVVDMLVPFRSAEDVELPLTYSGGVATRYIKKHATFRVETSAKNKRDISLAWLKKCVRKDLSEKEFNSNYLVNRHVMRQNGLCKGTVKKFYEKTQTYVVKFENGVEERVMLNSLLPMLISEDSAGSGGKNKDEDSAINARFVQALQLLERCGFLRTVSRRPNHIARAHTSMYLDSVKWVRE